MNDMDSLVVNFERERYALLSEMERFENLKKRYDELNERAKREPDVARQLFEFESQHGDMLIRNMSEVAAQLEQMKAQHNLLSRMIEGGNVDMNAANKNEPKSQITTLRKKASTKMYI
ncbi:hypothetical protein QNN88_10190 [Citrobacter sp. ANG330]|uniref:hypothetical protein n=1 Tax=Citrobacter sp. ANG330 TaxID=3048142 RepID=UPI0039C33034